MIRIAYVEDGRKKRATIEGSTMGDAIDWMRVNKPGVYIFRTAFMRRRRVLRPMFNNMVAADETGTGAHRPVRRRG